MRRILLVLLLVSMAACGRATMSSEQATDVAVAAFESAGLAPEVVNVNEDATVDRAGDGAFRQVHLVDLEVDGVVYQAGVDRKLGAVVRLIEPPETGLTEAEVETIAEYRDNPAEDEARPRRAITALAVLALLAGGAYLYFRNARLRSTLEGDDEEIPLT